MRLRITISDHIGSDGLCAEGELTMIVRGSDGACIGRPLVVKDDCQGWDAIRWRLIGDAIFDCDPIHDTMDSLFDADTAPPSLPTSIDEFNAQEAA